jgi:hypothetical protein
METRIFRKMIGTCAVISLLAAGLASADTLGAGTYKGTWTGATASGEIHITFRADGFGGLDPEVGFTLGGENVICKVLSFKPEDGKFTMVYEFDAQGNRLQSAIFATAKGKTLGGTYKTTAADQAVDSGTWKATVE